MATPPVYIINKQGIVSVACKLCSALVGLSDVTMINATWLAKRSTPVCSAKMSPSGYMEDVEYVGDQVKWFRATGKIQVCKTCADPFLSKPSAVIDLNHRRMA